jgi:phage repressor protein C with HTH and peptisase S24 domain
MAKKLGVNKNTLNDYELGKRVPDLEFLASFAATSGLRFLDLVLLAMRAAAERGVPDDYDDERFSRLQEELDQRLSLPPETMQTTLVKVPLYDVRISAGRGLWNPDEPIHDHINVPRDLLQRWSVNPEHAVFARNFGDSMEPTVMDGETVLLDRSAAEIVSDLIYAFRLNDELRIKRLRRLRGNGVELRSDNNRYEPERLNAPDLQDFKLVGRVAAVWRML